jgi:hypothetical protein
MKSLRRVVTATAAEKIELFSRKNMEEIYCTKFAIIVTLTVVIPTLIIVTAVLSCASPNPSAEWYQNGKITYTSS